MSAPALEPWCGSWIVTRRDTGAAVLETWSKEIADAINARVYRVETAAQYLGRINTEVALCSE